MRRTVCAADVMIFFTFCCTLLWITCIPSGAAEISKGDGMFAETLLFCKSPECFERAKLINESLNTRVHPCTDFYSYVCGQWESNHPLPSGRASYDVYEEIRKDIPQMLSYILGNRTLVESKQTIIDKVTTMYNACLALPDTGDALIRVLNESGFNGWPILTKENIFNATNATELLRHMNISAIFDVELSRYSSWRVAIGYQIFIKAKSVQQKIKEMEEQEVIAVINSTIRLLNPGMKPSELERLTNQLVEFSKNLSITMILRSLTREKTISELNKEYGNTIPISTLLKKEFEKANITFNDTEKLNVEYIYYKELSTFLATADPNTLYNYAGFLAFFPYLEYVKMSDGSELTMNTRKGRTWSECITLLDKNVPDILDYLYVTNQPNHTTIKNEATLIARRLQQALNETLQNNTWLGNTTREALQKKLEAVTVRIGYPEMLLNMSFLETRYDYVPFFPLNVSFTEALHHIKENAHRMKLRKFQYPTEGYLGWDHSPRRGQPSHNRDWTNIEIPYPLLVSPFFQQGLPCSLNYGGIGGAIASQLAHSINIIGTNDRVDRQFTESVTGNSLASYKNRTSCFVRQYKAFDKKILLELDNKYNKNTSAEADEYEAFFAISSNYDCYMKALMERHNVTEEPSGTKDNAMEKCLQYWREYFKKHDYYWPNLRVRWSQTLDEDVADNTGLHTAFHAYQKVLKEECDGQDTRLTGLEHLSGMQLLFISNARTHCRVANNATLINDIRWSQYSTARNRVNGAVKNSEEFSKAFNCSIDSPMNPGKSETCSFW